VLDQNAPHRLGRRAVKMAAVLEVHFAQARQAQIGLVDQCRRLQRVLGPFVAQHGARQLPELRVHRVDQRRQGTLVPSTPLIEQASDVSH
jgi:hypothetical protein